MRSDDETDVFFCGLLGIGGYVFPVFREADELSSHSFVY